MKIGSIVMLREPTKILLINNTHRVYLLEDSIMNIYKAFYRGKEKEVSTDTSYAAQLEAAKQFKAKKSYEVTVVLLAKDNQPVIHDPAEF